SLLRCSVGGEVRRDTEEDLCPTWVQPKAGDHFVEDERRAGCLRDAPHFVEKFARLPFRPPTLDRFDEHGGQLGGTFTDDCQGGVTAIVENQDIADGAGRNAGSARQCSVVLTLRVRFVARSVTTTLA